MSIPLLQFLYRLGLGATHALRRANLSRSDEQENYLRTASNLHQLENMQRQWAIDHTGRNALGAP